MCIPQLHACGRGKLNAPLSVAGGLSTGLNPQNVGGLLFPLRFVETPCNSAQLESAICHTAPFSGRLNIEH